MFFREASKGLLARRMVAQEPHGRLGEGSFEGGIPNLLPRGAIALAGGFFGACDEPAIRDARLHAWEAGDILDCIAQHEGQDLADPRDRAPAVKGLCIMRRRRLDQRPLQGGQPVVVRVDQREVDRKALLDGKFGKPFSHAGPVRLVGQLFAEIRPVIRDSGILNMGEPLRPLAHERHPAPEQIPCGSPLGGIDIGLGEHPAGQEDGDRVRIHCIVFGLAPGDGLHIEHMAQDKGHARLRAEVRQPGPR
jgi:hypothetical protein